MNIAKKVRLRKQMNPHLYCPNERCLWLVVHKDGKFTPCPKHMMKGEVHGT